MTVKAIEDYCKTHHYPLSEKRKQVIGQLASQKNASDAETIWWTLLSKEIKVSLASVYLILRWLSEKGLVERTVNSERKFLYNLVQEA